MDFKEIKANDRASSNIGQSPSWALISSLLEDLGCHHFLVTKSSFDTSSPVNGFLLFLCHYPLRLREWTLLGRAPVEVLLGVACEWGLGPCAAASIFKVLWALWGKGVQIFPQKKFFFFFFFTPNNYFQCSLAQEKSVQAKLVH